MGHNTPLAWAQSFHIISGQMLLNLSYKHPTHFRTPSQPAPPGLGVTPYNGPGGMSKRPSVATGRSMDCCRDLPGWPEAW